MSRWFRFYDDALNEPKLLKLSDALFRAWVGLLCIASKNAGRLPADDDCALMLRMKPERIAAVFSSLVSAGLIDNDEIGRFPHNWSTRQFRSDVSNERVGRYRERQRNVTPPVTRNVTVTPSEQSQNRTEQIQSREPVKKIDVAKERAPRALGANRPVSTSDPANRKAVWEQKVTEFITTHWPPDRAQAAITGNLMGTPEGKAEFELADKEMRAVRTDGSIKPESRMDRDQVLQSTLDGMAALRASA